MARGFPKMSKKSIRKLLANPKTPPQLKKFWRAKLKAMGG